MLIFWKRHLVFLANTKTGSTSIEMALESLADVAVQRPPALKHTTAARFSGLLAPFLGESAEGQRFETVAMIREPLDWLGSWFRYRARPGMKVPQNSTRGMSFDAFIDGYLSDTPPQPSRLGSQTDFMARADGRCGVTTLFPYERFNEAAAYLRRRLGTAAEPEAVNVSPHAELALSAELESRLRAERAADFALHQQALAGWDALAARIGA